jgi:hypothetical protein
MGTATRLADAETEALWDGRGVEDAPWFKAWRR